MMTAVNSTGQELENGMRKTKNAIMECVKRFLGETTGNTTHELRLLIGPSSREDSSVLKIFAQYDTLKVSLGTNGMSNNHCQVPTNLAKHVGLLLRSVTSSGNHDHIIQGNRYLFTGMSKKNIADLFSNATSDVLSKIQQNATQIVQHIANETLSNQMGDLDSSSNDSGIWSSTIKVATETAHNITTQATELFTGRTVEDSSTVWDNATRFIVDTTRHNLSSVQQNITEAAHNFTTQTAEMFTQSTVEDNSSLRSTTGKIVANTTQYVIDTISDILSAIPKNATEIAQRLTSDNSADNSEINEDSNNWWWIPVVAAAIAGISFIVAGVGYAIYSYRRSSDGQPYYKVEYRNSNPQDASNKLSSVGSEQNSSARAWVFETTSDDHHSLLHKPQEGDPQNVNGSQSGSQTQQFAIIKRTPSVKKSVFFANSKSSNPSSKVDVSSDGTQPVAGNEGVSNMVFLV